jgi:hypothetical protein
MEVFSYILVRNNKLKVFIRKYDNYFTYLIKIILFIQKWKNPILVLLLFLDKVFFKIVRILIYKIKIKYNYDLTASQLSKAFFIYYFIINVMLGPLKLFFGFIYTIMYRIIEIPFSLFFIIRIIGIVLSVLIFSDLFNSLYGTLGPLNLVVFIYFFLIFINCVIKYIDRDFEYLKIKYISNFINTDYLINLRNHCTFLGFILLSISWYKSTLIEKKYIDTMSTHLKLDLQEGFYKYWEFYKRNTWLNTTNIWKDITNRPSFYLYTNLITWINISSVNIQYVPSAITNIICIKCKIKYLNIILPEDLLRDLDFLYNFFLLRFKLLLFMIWDINDYIGNKDWDYINYEYNKEFKIFDINVNFNSFDFLDWNKFKIEDNKKDLSFYDLEINMEFFDRLYMIVGIIPYNENPLELTVFSNALIKVENLIEDIDSRLRKNCNSIVWDRGWYFNITNKEEQALLLIEEKVKDWIIQFLKEVREEWIHLLNKETIEERNWRLLNNIENLLLKI